MYGEELRVLIADHIQKSYPNVKFKRDLKQSWDNWNCFMKKLRSKTILLFQCIWLTRKKFTSVAKERKDHDLEKIIIIIIQFFSINTAVSRLYNTLCILACYIIMVYYITKHKWMNLIPCINYFTPDHPISNHLIGFWWRPAVLIMLSYIYHMTYHVTNKNNIRCEWNFYHFISRIRCLKN